MIHYEKGDIGHDGKKVTRAYTYEGPIDDAEPDKWVVCWLNIDSASPENNRMIVDDGKEAKTYRLMPAGENKLRVLDE